MFATHMIDKSFFLIYKELTQIKKISSVSSQEKQTERDVNIPQASTDRHKLNLTGHPATAESTGSSSVHGTFSKSDHVLCHKTRLSTFKRNEITQSVFPALAEWNTPITESDRGPQR